MIPLTAGDQVILHVPENPRLHGARGTVALVTEWGAHVSVQAAATGGYRAGWGEMISASQTNWKKLAEPVLSPTGDVCDTCGGSNMKRAGACLVCVDCGSSGGCG